MKLKKKLFGIITAMTVSFNIGTLHTHALTIYSVDFDHYRQERSLWCWVAGAENSGKHLVNSNRNQSGAVNFVKGSIVNDSGSIFETAQAANYFTYNNYNYVGVQHRYSPALFLAQMMSDRVPIAAGGYYNSAHVRQGGHVVDIDMVFYYDDDSVQHIGYYDVGDDCLYDCTYEEFCDGSFNGREYDQVCFTTD